MRKGFIAGIIVFIIAIVAIIVISAKTPYLRMEEELQKQGLMQEPWQLRPAGFRAEVATVSDWLIIKGKETVFTLKNLFIAILIAFLIKVIFAIPAFPIKGWILPVIGLIVITFTVLTKTKVVDIGPVSYLTDWVSSKEALAMSCMFVIPFRKIVMEKKRKKTKQE